MVTAPGPQAFRGRHPRCPLVKHIIEGHAGGVTVESAPGQGSTFTLALPMAEHVEGCKAPEGDQARIDMPSVKTLASDSVKTIPLRSLLREPTKVKRLTRSGQSVQITDNGKPLWLIQPAAQEQNDQERTRAIDQLLDEALRAPRSSVSAVALLEQSRR